MSKKEEFLLAPQRYLKKLISQGNVDLDAGEEALRAAALAKQEIKNKQSRSKPISSLEKKFYIQQKTTKENNEIVKLLKEIYSYIPTKSVLYLAFCSKMIYSNILQLKDITCYFTMKNFITFYCNGKNSKRIQNFGLIRDKLLAISQDGDTALNSDIEIFVDFFTNFNGGFRLQSLQVSINTDVGDLEIECFMSSLKNPKITSDLETLNFSNSTLGNDGLSILADLIKDNFLSNLMELDVSHNSASDTVIQKLRVALSQGKCNQLYKLNIAGNNVGAAILDFVYSPFVGKLSPISIFDASNNSLDLMDIEVLPILSRGKLSFYHLRILDLSSNPLGDSGFIRLLKIVWPFKKLNTAIINSPKNGTNSPSTKGLNDSPTGTIGSNEFRSPSNASMTSSKWDLMMYDDIPLEQLHLNHTVIGDSSMVHICNLIAENRMTSLNTLSLSGNEISIGSLKMLLEVIKSAESLKNLYLSLNNLSNEGMLCFIQAAIARNLDQLSILDIADVGANSDSISQFVRILSSLDPTTGLLQMSKLFIYGKSDMHRLKLPKDFHTKIL